MPLTTIGLTSAQVRALIGAVKEHCWGVRIERLSDAYARVVLIGPEGDPIEERLLPPA
jgi:hypothetical protein